MERALAEVAHARNVYAKVSNGMRRVEGKVIESSEAYRPALEGLWKLFGAYRSM
jgi:predicted TIM-barrel fold metal-dependent hydrolase